MEGIFKKVLNFPSPFPPPQRIDEKVLTLYFIRGCPIGSQTRKKTLPFPFRNISTTCINFIARHSKHTNYIVLNIVLLRDSISIIFTFYSILIISIKLHMK